MLSLVTIWVVSYPVIRGRRQGVFYAVDPDVVYIANALSYIKSAQIQYIDHPGTVAVRLIAQQFWPLRVYAKLVAHIPFIDWARSNLAWLYLYSRLWQSVLLGLAMFVFLSAVRKISQSAISVLLAGLAALSFTALPYAGSSISAEGTLVLLTGLWSWVMAGFLNDRSILRIIVASGIAGLALANRFTSVLLVILSLISVLSLAGLTAKQKVLNLVLNLAVVTMMFIVGTWPIRDRYPELFGWVGRLASSSGVHATGGRDLLNWPVYMASARTLFDLEIYAAVAAGAAVISVLGRGKRDFLPLAWVLTSVGTILVFAKFPLSHYQLANYLVVVFIAAPRLKNFPVWLRLGVIAILIFGASRSLTRYTALTQAAVVSSAALQTYIDAHPARGATVWEWGRSRDFAVLWSNVWGGNVFGQQAQLLDLSRHSADQLGKLCWDRLYVQQVSLATVAAKYHLATASAQMLPDGMAVVESDHCLATKL